MDFRRIPFQFTSTDPAKRQAELQKRFGLPVNKDKEKMHIDFANPGLMGIRPDGMGSATNSPRLQHRVPLFKEGSPEPMKSSVDSQSSPVAGRKPHVRVVPIEIEGDDNSTKQHRNLSGPPVEDHPLKNGASWLPEEFPPCSIPPFPDPTKPNMPRERTIPIQVEGAGQSKKAKTVLVKTEKSANSKKEAGLKQNGCSPSKVDKPPSQPKQPLALSLKKIDNVLAKLKTYHANVEKFTCTVKEKQYRYLDEMLTRLMLELDDVDTMGNEEVRLSRKAAVRQVQASLDLLEAKVTGRASKQMPEEPVEHTLDEDVEMRVPISRAETATSNTDCTMSDCNENKCQVTIEPASTVVIQDVEMEISAEDGKILEETSSETSVVKEGKELQVMEVDVDTKPIEFESAAATINSSAEEPTCSGEVNVVTDVNIEEVNELSKESEHVLLSNEPLVSVTSCPIKELHTTDNVINEVPSLVKESTELKMESNILSDTSDCVQEVVTKSCHIDASGKDISNSEHKLIPDKHSIDINTEYSEALVNSSSVL